MTTADAVRELALALARASVDRDEAVRELEALCGADASPSSGLASRC
jgi:hypothetical protein